MGRSNDRSDRLDPVRWRPGRSALVRLAAIAVLLVTAAGLLWYHPAPVPCAMPSADASARSSPAAKAKAAGKPSIPAGTVGVPVRLADPTALSLVHPGNRVDLLRLNAEGASTPVASAALVLDVTGAADPATGALLLALGPDEAGRAVTAPERGFAILIRPG